ncbi:hypothetical protein M885DRAFT_533265 [Pelagophyceae sp. CCMP2097]|nr:hypothetical protein M885DRAFT_533265 [Pelagophyceae sp. CCMP2097]
MGCRQSKPRQGVSRALLAETPQESKRETGTNVVLTISHVTDIPPDVLALKIAANPTRLVVLRLLGVPLGDSGAAALARAVVHGTSATTLRALRVATCALGSEGATSLAGALQASQIMHLDLSDNAIRADGVKALAAAVRGRSAKHGAEAWGRAGSVFELRLSENPLVETPPHVGVAALADLATALAQHVPRRKALALRSVGMRFDSRTSQHGPALLEALCRGDFAYVDLRSNSLDDDAGVLLAAAVAAALSAGGERAPEMKLTSTLLELHAAAARLPPGAPFAANAPAFSAFDLEEHDRHGSSTAAACVASLRAAGASAEWCTLPFIEGVRKDERLLNANGLIDLDEWRSMLSRISASRAPQGLARLDVRFNPLGRAAEAALKRAWVAARAQQRGGDELLLLLEPASRSDSRSKVARPVRILKAAASARAPVQTAVLEPAPPAKMSGFTAPPAQMSGFYEETKESVPPNESETVRWVVLLAKPVWVAAVEATLAATDLDGEVSFRVSAVEATTKGVSRLLISATAVDFAWDWLDEEMSDQLAKAHADVMQVKRLAREDQVPRPLQEVAPAEAAPQQPAASRRPAKAIGGWSAEAKNVAKLLVIYEDGGNDLQDALRRFDTSGDGEISISELHAGLKALGTAFADLQRSDVQSIIDEACDEDEDAHVSLEELRAFAHKGRRLLAEERTVRRPAKSVGGWSPAAKNVARLLVIYEDGGNDLQDALRKFDTSGDGEISISELDAGLRKLGSAFADLQRSDVQSIIDEACDEDEDAHVSLDELRAFVHKGRRLLAEERAAADRPLDVARPSDGAAQGERPLSADALKVARLLMIYEDSGNTLGTAFTRFDVSSDGEISVSELHAGLVKLGDAFSDLTREDVQTIVTDAFRADSHVSFADFEDFVRRARRQDSATL